MNIFKFLNEMYTEICTQRVLLQRSVPEDDVNDAANINIKGSVMILAPSCSSNSGVLCVCRFTQWAPAGVWSASTPSCGPACWALSAQAASSSSLARWMDSSWWAGGGTMLTTSLPRRWQWSRWNSSTGAGECEGSLSWWGETVRFYLNMTTKVTLRVSGIVSNIIRGWEPARFLIQAHSLSTL